jgi:hypothetical protein
MRTKPLAFLLFFLSLAFYIYTLQPSLAWGDGIRLQREVITAESFILAELVDVDEVDFAPDPYPFARLGVAAWDHPLYVMVGHTLVKALPGVYSLWLVNLLSAVFGAGAVVMLFLYGRRHLKRWWAALYAALALAVSHTFWWHAATPEVYTLFAFLLLLSLYWFDAYEQNGRARYALGSAFALGLGAANHLMAFLALPALLLYWLLDGRWRRPLPSPGQVQDLPLLIRSLGLLTGCLLAFWIGFAPYWIQFIRLLRTFPLETVMGPAIGTTFFRGSLALTPLELAESLAGYLLFLVYQFNPLGVAIGVYGWWRGRRAFPRLWKQTFALYIVYLLFGLVYQVADQFAFFLGAHVFWAVAMGMGLASVGERHWSESTPRQRWSRGAEEQRRFGHWLVAGCWLSLLLMPVFYGQAPGLLRAAGVTEEAFGVPQVGIGVRDGLEYYVNPSKRADMAAHTFGVSTLESLPLEAVVLAEWYTDTDEYFVLRYFTVVEGLRPDVTILGWPLEDPFRFDPVLATGVIAAELPGRPVYLASLSEEFYNAPLLLAEYCIVPEHNLYRIYPPDEAKERPCLQ